MFQAGGYARHQMGLAYFAGMVAYGWQDATTERTAGTTDVLHGHVQTNTFAARGESGWRIATSFANATPYAAVQVSSTRLPGYGETSTSGSSQFALAYADYTTNNVRTELGLRADKSFQISDGQFILRGRAAWAHDSDTSRSAAPSFQALSGTSFIVYGAAPAADALLTTASVEIKWPAGFAIGAALDSELSRTTRSIAGRGIVRYFW